MPLPEYNEWPDASHVQTLLRGTGLLSEVLTSAQQLYDWEGCIAGVVSDFEQATKHIPFLAEEDPVTLSISVTRPATLLNLPASFAAVTQVTVNTLGRGGSGQDATTLVQGEDYALEPLSAADLGKPYTMLRLYPPFTRRTNILLSVTGRRGYAAVIPASVFQAVLEQAAVRAEAVLRTAEPGALEKIKLGDIEEQYATSVTERLNLSNRADAMWKAAIRHFRKITIS